MEWVTVYTYCIFDNHNLPKGTMKMCSEHLSYGRMVGPQQMDLEWYELTITGGPPHIFEDDLSDPLKVWCLNCGIWEHKSYVDQVGMIEYISMYPCTSSKFY